RALESWLHDLAGGPGIGGALEDDRLAATESALDGVGGGDDVADVRILELGERSGHADRDGVGLAEARHVGRRTEAPRLYDLLKLRVAHVLDVGVSGVQPIHHLLLNVEPEHTIARVGQLDAERQTDVALTHDT